MHYVMLDNQLTTLLMVMLNTNNLAALCIADGVPDVSKRCDLLKKLAFLDPVTEKWRDALSMLLDRISGVIAPARNRYIHDPWHYVNELGWVQLHFKSQILKPQAGEPKKLTHAKMNARTQADMNSLISEILCASAEIQSFIGNYHPAQKELPEE